MTERTLMEIFVRAASSTMRRGRSWAVILVRHPVHAVLSLVGVFVHAARLRRAIEAEFMALLLRVVYVGAIAVLFLFVVMMLNRQTVSAEAHSPLQRVWRGTRRRRTSLTTAYFSRVSPAGAPTSVVGTSRAWVTSLDASSNRQARGQFLYADARELVVVAGGVLLVARVGAVVLTLKVRTDVRAKRQQLYQQRSRDADAARVHIAHPLTPGVRR